MNIGTRIKKEILTEDDKNFYAKMAEFANQNNYRIVEEGDFFVLREVVFTQEERIANQIHTLKQKLAETDYQVIKFVEGCIGQFEYSSLKMQRQQWRDEINRLQNNSAAGNEMPQVFATEKSWL